MQLKLLPIYLFNETDNNQEHLTEFLQKFKDSPHFLFCTSKQGYGHFLTNTDELMKNLGLSEEQRKKSIYISNNDEKVDIQNLAHMFFYHYIAPKKEIKYGYDGMLIVSSNTNIKTIDKALLNAPKLIDNFYICVDENEPERDMSYKDNRAYIINLRMMVLKYHDNVKKANEQTSIDNNTELQPI